MLPADGHSRGDVLSSTKDGEDGEDGEESRDAFVCSYSFNNQLATFLWKMNEFFLVLGIIWKHIFILPNTYS